MTSLSVIPLSGPLGVWADFCGGGGSSIFSGGKTELSLLCSIDFAIYYRTRWTSTKSQLQGHGEQMMQYRCIRRSRRFEKALNNDNVNFLDRAIDELDRDRFRELRPVPRGFSPYDVCSGLSFRGGRGACVCRRSISLTCRSTSWPAIL